MRIKTENTSDKITQSFKTKEVLCGDIWEGAVGTPKMKTEVRKQLLEISNEFLDFLVIELDVVDIIMTGSLSNYNWSDFSDVDLHVVLDFEDVGENTELIKEFFDSKRINWNTSHNIKVKGFEVELYVQDETEAHFSSGVYSVLKDKWVVEPKPGGREPDDEKLISKVTQWMKIIDEVIAQKDGTSNPQSVIDDINKVRKKLKRFRSTGLEEYGEYSYENLVFKYLRRNGYIGKLIDAKNELVDRTLSLDEVKIED
jgi:predicted nucleotidyltransferase